jgi:hypothetical protein
MTDRQVLGLDEREWEKRVGRKRERERKEGGQKGDRKMTKESVSA